MSIAAAGKDADSILSGPLTARRTIQEVVYQRLSYALMTGQFDPGATLTISYLSELFGTSHKPVREALRRLTAENALGPRRPVPPAFRSSREPALTTFARRGWWWNVLR